MRRRWPRARFEPDDAATAPLARRAFEPKLWRPDAPLRVVMIGSDFEVRVWETLLRVPFACATTYGDIAAHLGKPSAARAVGAAVGRNPISFVVPCHRVLGRSGRSPATTGASRENRRSSAGRPVGPDLPGAARAGRSGAGAATMPEPENLVMAILREMREEMATKSDVAQLDAKIDDARSEVHSLRADVASDMLSLEKRLGDRIATLNRAVMEYHSSTIGHGGALYSEIDERVRRIEQHLQLDAARSPPTAPTAAGSAVIPFVAFGEFHHVQRRDPPWLSAISSGQATLKPWRFSRGARTPPPPAANPGCRCRARQSRVPSARP